MTIISWTTVTSYAESDCHTLHTFQWIPIHTAKQEEEHESISKQIALDFKQIK